MILRYLEKLSGPPMGYKNVLKDTFQTDVHFDENWIIGQPWGIIHPKNTYQWYSPDEVFTTDEGLNLSVSKAPASFDIGGREIVSDYGVGLVSSTKTFKYGYFRIVARLPKSRGVWPAIWLCEDVWPPEIDILEGYCKHNRKYGFWFLKSLYLKSNLFFRSPNKYEGVSLGACTHSMPFIDCTKLFVEFTCLWTPESIKIAYNNVVVRTIDNPIILRAIDETTNGMRIILNNAIIEGREHLLEPCTLTIKSVEVWQK